MEAEAEAEAAVAVEAGEVLANTPKNREASLIPAQRRPPARRLHQTKYPWARAVNPAAGTPPSSTGAAISCGFSRARTLSLLR